MAWPATLTPSCELSNNLCLCHQVHSTLHLCNRGCFQNLCHGLAGYFDTQL